MNTDDVSAAIYDVGRAEVLPRFRSLAEGDVTEKSPGDLVTIADRECERALAERLRAIRDAPVVGEEATAEDSSLLDLVDTADTAWIVDPIDGTSNFVNGNPDFAVMVALVERGATTHAWIWQPVHDLLLVAERGHGVRLNDSALPTVDRAPDARGIVKRKYMPEPLRGHMANLPTEIGTQVPGYGCAGVEYHALVTGRIDFLFYWRTWPWDHAPGGLIAHEAGLRVARPDGVGYQPGDDRHGILSALPTVWDSISEHVDLVS